MASPSKERTREELNSPASSISGSGRALEELRKQLLVRIASGKRRPKLSQLILKGDSGYSSSGTLTPTTDHGDPGLSTPLRVTYSPGTLTPTTNHEDGISTPLRVTYSPGTLTPTTNHEGGIPMLLCVGTTEHEDEPLVPLYSSPAPTLEDVDGITSKGTVPKLETDFPDSVEPGDSSHIVRRNLEMSPEHVASDFDIDCAKIILPTSYYSTGNKLHKSLSASDSAISPPTSTDPSKNTKTTDLILQTTCNKTFSKSLNDLVPIKESSYQSSFDKLIYINSPEFPLSGFSIKSDEVCEWVSQGESFNSSSDNIASSYTQICADKITVTDSLVPLPLPIPDDCLQQENESSCV